MNIILSPRQQAAQAAQRRYRHHVTKVCKVPAGVRCRICDHLDAVAAGLWIRAAGQNGLHTDHASRSRQQSVQHATGRTPCDRPGESPGTLPTTLAAPLAAHTKNPDRS